MNRLIKAGAGVGAVGILAGVGALIWAALAHTIHPNGDIGYGDIAVGVGTLILAVVTLGSVVLGWIALGDTRSELEAAQRPVVVPVLSDAIIESPVPPSPVQSPDPRPESQARPTALEGGMLTIPIRNIGAGPALSVTVLITGRNDAGEYSEAWGNRMHDGYVYAAPVGDTIPVLVAIDRLSGSTPSFDLMIAYRDLAGRNWATTARYRRAGNDGRYGMYFAPEVQRLAGSDDPGESMLAEQRQLDELLQEGKLPFEPPPEDDAIY